MDLFKFYTLKKIFENNQKKTSKNCFDIEFKVIFQKKILHSGKVSSDIKAKFQFFGIKESLKIIRNKFVQEEI